MSVSTASSHDSINVPVNVSDIEDFAQVPRDLRVTSHVFRLDASLSKICSHCKVCDGGDHGDGGGDIMEDAVGTRLAVGETDKDQCRHEHCRADSLSWISCEYRE